MLPPRLLPCNTWPSAIPRANTVTRYNNDVGTIMLRTFAIRLICPKCDFQSWSTLPGRKEPLEDIFRTAWDVACPNHGGQKAFPREALELATPESPRAPATLAETSVRGKKAVPLKAKPAHKTPRSSERVNWKIPVVIYGFTPRTGAFHEETETLQVNTNGALVILRTPLELDDRVFLIHKSSHMEQEMRVANVEEHSYGEHRIGLAFKETVPGFWRKARKRPRLEKSLRVVVRGTDRNGNPFVQSARTIDLSRDGARIDSVGFLTAVGETIEVRRYWRKARFRVVWIGQIGSAEADHVGVHALQDEKQIWGVPLPEGTAPKPLIDRNPSKK